MKRSVTIVFLLLCCFYTASAQTRTGKLKAILLSADKNILNPVLNPGDQASLTVRGLLYNGQTVNINAADVVFSAKNKLSSGADTIIEIKQAKAIAREGGVVTVTAVFTNGTETLTASTDITVRPYYREYHQTLVLKLFMGMEGEPVAKLAKEPVFQKQHDVLCTFEQALEVIRKTDNLTLGIPKIIYLIGWQKGGHDHQYPSWDEVNPKLKRPQDSTALQSLRWLIVAARKYHTTVSLHINMADAYKSSPLWDEYVAKDVIAKDEKGRLLTSGIQIKGDSMYNVSYTREWREGLAQRRIDRLIKMVPELKEGHTIHVDVFVAKTEHQATLSPWHALPQNGGIDIYKEVETQRKIFKYWRKQGFDVTGEGLFWAHPPGEGFYGLQPMAWWYPSDISYQMQTPEWLSARGRTDRNGDGDFRFGSSMHGEEIFIQDEDNLPGFMQQFCRTTLPWYYLSRLSRLALINDTLFYSGGVKAFTAKGHHIISKGQFLLRDNNDLFVPALWLPHTIVAYSETGYNNRRWKLPADWNKVKKVDLYRVGITGAALVEKEKAVINGEVELTLPKETALYLVPSSTLPVF